eukprot:2689134-Amphidinium_carterae.2
MIIALKRKVIAFDFKQQMLLAKGQTTKTPWQKSANIETSMLRGIAVPSSAARHQHGCTAAAPAALVGARRRQMR